MNIAKPCNVIKVVKYPFPFQTSLLHTESGQQACITLIQTYIHTQFNVEADYLMGKVDSRINHVTSNVSTWGQLDVDLLPSSCTNQLQHYYTLENHLSLRALGLNVYHHSWTYKMSYIFPYPTLVLSQFLAEHVTGQFRLVILVAPCWMEAPWLPQFSTC